MKYRPTFERKAGFAILTVAATLVALYLGQEGVHRGAEQPSSFCPNPNTVLAFPTLISLYELAQMPPDAYLPCFYMGEVLGKEGFNPSTSALDEAIGRQYKLSLLDHGSLNLELSTVGEGEYWKTTAPETLQIVLVSKINDGTYRVSIASNKQTYLALTQFMFNDDSYGPSQPSDAFQEKYGDLVMISAHPEFEPDGEHESLKSFIQKLVQSPNVDEVVQYATDDQGNLVITSLKQTP